jgi:two-component system phosphate regulon sensor histidine kinase PhoR
VDLGRTTSTNVAPAPALVPFEALAQFSLDGLAYVDASGAIVSWNDAAASLTGIPSERARGTSLSALFSNIAAFVSREPRAHSVRLSPIHDPLRTIDATYLPLAHGTLLSFGPQRRFAAIEQVKNEILASVSHELKTPIAVIKAYATTLRQRHDATEHTRDEYLATIEEQADVLDRGVDELLLASRADAQNLPVRRVTSTLAPILDAALAEIAAKHDARTVERLDNGNIYGDPDLLRHAFAQVLDNAFTFSSAPSSISVEATSDASETIVRIIDRGIGIAAEHLPYIFERFYRVEANLTAVSAGTGLGLHVANSIVRAHGGTIGVESELGKGSAFIVSIPFRHQEGGAA